MARLAAASAWSGVLFLQVALGTLADRWLEPQALHRDGAAVDAAQQALPLQRGQVAAHGLRRYLKLCGKRRDVDPSLGPGSRDDQLEPLFRVHPLITSVSSVFPQFYA